MPKGPGSISRLENLIDDLTNKCIMLLTRPLKTGVSMLDSIVVLGLIPGTNIQISFTAWLVMLALSPFFIKYVWRPKLAPWLGAELQEGLIVLMWTLMLMPGLHHWPPYATPSHRQAL